MRNKKRTAKQNPRSEGQKKPQLSNCYDALSKLTNNKEGSGDKGEKGTQRKGKEKDVEEPWHSKVEEQIETEEIEVDVEDMELGEIDLDGIEKACANPKTGYISFSQIALLKEALIKSKGVRGLGVVSDSMKGGEGKRRGR